MNIAPSSPLEILLEESLGLHEMGAEIFAPFVIERLDGGTCNTSAELVVTVTEHKRQTQRRRVTLMWNSQSAAKKQFAVQERVQHELRFIS